MEENCKEREAAIAELCSQTGIDRQFSEDLLRGRNWDLICALKAYQAICADGVVKNGDMKLAVVENSEKLAEKVNSETKNDKTAAVKSAPLEARAKIPNTSTSTIEQLENGHFLNNNNNNNPTATTTTTTTTTARKCSSNSNSSSQQQHNKTQLHIETPCYTFTLPDLDSFDLDFRRFLEKDLIETSTLKGLESSGKLNWWAEGGIAEKLLPLVTTGDGNCLLHAASLGMWGFHDRLLVLRKALHLTLTEGSRRHALWRRWRWQQHCVNRLTGLELTEAEWRREWDSLVRLASPQPKPSSSDKSQSKPKKADGEAEESESETTNMTYESLEELHVFALAHVLKRPIVVVADTVLKNASGEDIAPIPFGGVYLPLECPPSECHRSPLVLCYDAAHFSALVVMERQKKKTDTTVCSASSGTTPRHEGGGGLALAPLTDKNGQLLPVQFCCDPGPDFTWWRDGKVDENIAERTQLEGQGDETLLFLLSQYLDLVALRRNRPRQSCSTAAMTLLLNGKENSVIPQRNTLPRESDNANCRPSPSRRLSRRSLLRWANSLKRRLSSAGNSRTAGGGGKKNEQNGAQLLHDVDWLVGAALRTEKGQHHPQYMDEMLARYLRSARRRFSSSAPAKSQQNAQKNGARSRRWDLRISRSMITSNSDEEEASGEDADQERERCVNAGCDSAASHTTNFLCRRCFLTQKQLVKSFRGGGTFERQRVAPLVHDQEEDEEEEEENESNVSKFASSDDWPEGARTTAASVIVRGGSGANNVVARKQVNAVTNVHGVTHYYYKDKERDALEGGTRFCRRVHCQFYSNGHATLCANCAKN